MPDSRLVYTLSGDATAGQGDLTPASRHLKIMPAVLRCCSRAQALMSEADRPTPYVLNRHLKTLAGIIFDSPAKQGLNLFLHSRIGTCGCFVTHLLRLLTQVELHLLRVA